MYATLFRFVLVKSLEKLASYSFHFTIVHYFVVADKSALMFVVATRQNATKFRNTIVRHCPVLYAHNPICPLNFLSNL